MASYRLATALTALDRPTQDKLGKGKPGRNNKPCFGGGGTPVTDSPGRSYPRSEASRFGTGPPKPPVLKHARHSNILGPMQTTRVMACFPESGAPRCQIPRYRRRS